MKKIIFAVALFVATMFASCGNDSKCTATDVDSVAVDSVEVVDSVAVDSVAANPTLTDSVACSCKE